VLRGDPTWYARCGEPRREASPPETDISTGERRAWKLACGVRRRAGGKGLLWQYLACGLSYYDLNEPLPDHSSLTRIRSRYGLAVFRRFFEAIVEQCCQAKLVWGRELYVDATKVNANADLDSLVPRFAVEARQQLQAHLAALFEEEPAEQADQAPPDSGQDAPPLLSAETTETTPLLSPPPCRSPFRQRAPRN
jgi:hypothetical protein